MNQTAKTINLASQELTELDRIFQLQKSNYSPAKAPSYELRMDRLKRIEILLKNHLDEIVTTIEKDFGTRSADYGFLSDIYSPLHLIQRYKKSLKQWMQPEKKASGFLGLMGQRDYLVYEPLGVVGIMSPFNAPVSLAFDPAIEAIAAGNTAIIKFSEATPHTGMLMQKLVAKYFKEEEIAVINGGLEVSIAFVDRAWDLFFFTGGSETGKKILAATAKHLTPTILELGGKSPCIVLDDADLDAAAERIGTVRQMNAGQVCISGDYVFVPQKDVDSFVEKVIKNSEEIYPSIIDNPYITSIINDSEYNRITSWIAEAQTADCRVIIVNPKNETVPDVKTRKIPLTIVVDPPKDLKVAQLEIFGPVLTVFSYNNLDEVIRQINKKEKPLALYIFGKKQSSIDKIIHNTSSGGVTINDLMMHANAQEMGFGGVGYSGMGRYKGGKIGFKAFSNAKSVVKQGLMKRYSKNFTPPYKSERFKKMLRSQVGVK